MRLDNYGMGWFSFIYRWFIVSITYLLFFFFTTLSSLSFLLIVLLWKSTRVCGSWRGTGYGGAEIDGGALSSEVTERILRHRLVIHHLEHTVGCDPTSGWLNRLRVNQMEDLGHLGVVNAFVDKMYVAVLTSGSGSFPNSVFQTDVFEERATWVWGQDNMGWSGEGVGTVSMGASVWECRVREKGKKAGKVLKKMTETNIATLKPEEANRTLEAKVYQKLISKSVPDMRELAFCCILIDKEGDAIEANMDIHNIEHFNPRLKLGVAYRISSGNIVEFTMWDDLATQF
nr:hypothetical protein [Tanacetum cinerariifolium]